MAKHKYRTVNGKIFANALVGAVAEELEEFGTYVSDVAIKNAIEKTSEYAVQELQARSPRASGAYARDWTDEEEYRPKSWQKARIVYNREHYRLTHLLEKGHHNPTAKHGLKDTPPSPAGGHIAPVEAELGDKIVEWLKREIESGA